MRMYIYLHMFIHVHLGKILVFIEDIVQPAHSIGLNSLFANWNHMMLGDSHKLIKYYDIYEGLIPPKQCFKPVFHLSLCFL
jgi:hypothetical protein